MNHEQVPRRPPPKLSGNVRLRFFLGPTNLGILRCADQVMAEHPVIIHQVDFRFDVYGRPRDVADAIVDSFLVPKNRDLEASTTATTAATQQHQANTSENRRNSTHDPRSTSNSGPSRHPTTAATVTTEADQRKMTTRRMSRDQQDIGSNQHGNQDQDQEAQALELTFIPILQNQTLVHGHNGSGKQRQNHPTQIRKAKTDAELELSRQAHLRENRQEVDPASLITVILSLPEKMAHYLIHLTGGFMSYLVEESNLGSCAKNNISLENLKTLSQNAGLSVALSKIIMPDMIDAPIWIQVADIEALRVILHGVAMALARDPLWQYERRLATPQELDLRDIWDANLSQRQRPAPVQDDKWITSQLNKKEKERNGWKSSGNQDSRQTVSQTTPRSAQDQDDQWSPWGYTQNVESPRDEEAPHYPSPSRTLSESEAFYVSGESLTPHDHRYPEAESEMEGEIERAAEWASDRILIRHSPSLDSAMATFSHYYRVKRQTQTIFINTPNPNSDTVLSLKQRIIKALAASKGKDNGDGVQVPTAASDIQLHIPDKRNPSSYVELTDSKTLTMSGLVDQQVIAMTYRTLGGWEEVHIAQPEDVEDLDDLEDEAEDVEVSRSSKGKERA
ncbi:hypothetical protein BGX31_003417 [Mortierella sp. GBA43]|nr:hypothetical protein BGX31_003417 [Mortierella sp. GBA43]